MQWINDNFSGDIPAHWQIGEIGMGRVLPQADGTHLQVPQADDATYHDAQLTDYDPKQRNFLYQPPLRLSVTAYASTNDLRGTAGFGFWNHPFVPGERGVRLPQAVWFFFASAESNLALAQGVPGYGWKATTFNAQRAGFLALLPTAPLGFLLMNVPAIYRGLWPIGQQALGVHEAALDSDLLLQPHTYALEWRSSGASFFVDGRQVLHAKQVPTKPLGFIAWLDNQYAVVTPQGRFGFGFVAVPHAQSLFVQHIRIEPL